MVNDVSGLRYDPALAGVVAEAGAALVLMHTRGRSEGDVRRGGLRRPDGRDRRASFGESMALGDARPACPSTV